MSNIQNRTVVCKVLDVFLFRHFFFFFQGYNLGVLIQPEINTKGKKAVTSPIPDRNLWGKWIINAAILKSKRQVFFFSWGDWRCGGWDLEEFGKPNVVKEQEMEVEPDRWETEEERWRGSVYKRSDAAQSVLVMTQLALHIATNHSPPWPPTSPPSLFLVLAAIRWLS